jgi:hypothetical protein
MNESIVRRSALEHAEAVRTLNLERAAEDLAPELHAQITAMAGLLPTAMTGAELESLDCHQDHAESVTRYIGSDASIRIRARWEDRGAGRPQIVEAAPLAT